MSKTITKYEVNYNLIYLFIYRNIFQVRYQFSFGICWATISMLWKLYKTMTKGDNVRC